MPCIMSGHIILNIEEGVSGKNKTEEEIEMVVGKPVKGYVYTFTRKKEESIVWAESWSEGKRLVKKSHPERTNLKMIRKQ